MPMLAPHGRWARWQPVLYFGAGVVRTLVTTATIEVVLGDQARRVLQEVLDASVTPIHAFDCDCRALLMNTACAKVLGQSVDTLLGQTRAAMHSPEYAAAHDAVDRQVFETGQPVTVEERADVRTSGTYRKLVRPG